MATKTVPTAWTTSIWAMRTTIMTQTTSTRMTRTITTRASCTCEHGTWSAQSPSVLMLCHTHLIGSRCSWVFIPSTCHPWASLLDLAFLPFYFDLSFTVFFHSSVLMHPEAHTDLDNLNTVQHNLRNSAKGRLWAQRNGLQRVRQLPRFLLLRYTVIGPGHRQAAHRSTPRIRRLPMSGRCVSQSVVIVCSVR